MDNTVKMYADLADKAGIIHSYDSTFLMTRNKKLSQMFEDKVADITTIADVHGLEGFKQSRFDKIIIDTNGYSFDTIVEHIPKILDLTNTCVAIVNIGKIHKDALDKIEQKYCNSKECYPFKYKAIWKDTWEKTTNALILI